MDWRKRMENNCILGFDEVFTDGIIVGNHGLSEKEINELDMLTKKYIEEHMGI